MCMWSFVECHGSMWQCNSQESYSLQLLSWLHHFSWAWCDFVMFNWSWPQEMAGQITLVVLQQQNCLLTRVVWQLSGETWTNICLPLDRDLMVEQSMDTTKVQIGVTTYWGYLMSRNSSKIAVSPKSTSQWKTAHKSWAPGAHCTMCQQLSRLESVFSRWLSCPEPLQAA